MIGIMQGHSPEAGHLLLLLELVQELDFFPIRRMHVSGIAGFPNNNLKCYL